MHSVGWVDSSGFRHVKIQPSSEAPSPESLAERVDENLLIRQQRPSQSGLKRFSLSAILFHLVRSMVRLIKQICHKAPPEITQGLYEEILLGTSSKAIKGATESETLEFLCNFLKKSPHLKDEVVLKELSQAAKWAKQLENAAVLPIEKFKNNIIKNIVGTLRGLKTGEGCVLPGGALATFRITKTGEKTCNLELFSRHPDFPGVESVEAGGKQKVRGCVFQGLSLEELTQPIWIESFLQATQTGNPDSYNAVLANFTARMIPSEESRIPFHASKEALCRVQNVWDMVHATSSSKQRMHRRKLGLQLEALYGFFQQQKADLKPDSVAFLYLKEGVNKVAKTTLAVGADLTPDEKAKIEADLAAIDTYLNTLSPQPQKLSIPTSPKNAALFLATPSVKTDTPSISPTVLPATTTSPLPIRAYPTENAEYVLAAHCDLSTRKACIDALTALQNEIVKGSLSPAEEIQKITQLCLLLPLTPSPTMHDYKQNKVLKQNWDHNKIAGEDIWYTPESNADAIKEVEEVSTLLTDLSSRLYTHIKKMPSVVPRHFLSLTKCTALTSHLAKNRGLFTESPDLLAAIQDLLEGSSLQDTKFSLWSHRGSISQSLYPLQTRMEQTALEQLRQYAGLMADLLPNRGDFRRADGYWGFGDDPSFPLEGTKDLAPQRRELASQLTHLLDLVQKTPYQKMTLGRDVMSLFSKKADDSGFHLGAVSRQWGQSLHNPLLLAILHGFKLDQGSMTYGKVNKYNTVTVEYGDPCTYTQEAIMDNPWAAVERAFNAWQKDLPAKDPLKKKTFAQISALAKPDLEKILSEEQLKELLINMSRSGATWGMMGFMKNNPSTLEHPAIQALIERLLLQPGALKATCAIDPEFPKMLSAFFTTHLDRLQGTKKISSYLFLHRLSRRVAGLLPEKIAFPENLPLIRQWTEKAIQHNSSLAPMRKQLLTEWVDILGSRSKLSDSEISEYLLASAKLHATSSEQTSPAEELDLLQQQYCQWLPQIKSALTTNKKLLAYSLNHICAEQGIPLFPERTWTGDFPTYRANDGWEVNLSSLRVSSLQGKVLPVSWPTEILASPDFKEVFPSFDPLLHSCYFSKKKEKCYYQSTDTQGRTHLVEQQPDGTLSFFLSAAETGRKWAKRIPCSKEGGTLTAEHQLYVSGKKGWLLDRQGTVQFIVDRVSTTKTGVSLDQIQACHPKQPIKREMRGTFFDPNRYPELAPLLQLSSPADIILWKEGSQLRHVELRNSGLFLTLQNGELVGAHPPLKGYKLDLTSPPPLGLATGALFLSQDPLQKQRKWVLPRFGGRYELNPLPHQNKNFFFKLFFRSPSTLSPSHHQALLQKWRWKWGTGHEPGIWTFDVAPSTLSIVSSPKEPKGCVDLLKQALFACSTSPQEALLAAHQALEQLELLPSNAISSEEMEKLFYDIKQLPKQARLFEKSASPALLSLLLKTGLKMRDRASPAIKVQWNKQMAIWIPFYFKMGRKMSEEALLSPKEELLCLMLMEEHNAPWFQKHGPLLATLHPHGSSEPFKGIFLSLPTMHSIRRGASSTKFDTYALRHVIDESLPIIKDTQDRSFTALYQIAKTGKREDLTHVLAKLQQKLQSMDEVEMLAESRSEVTISKRMHSSSHYHNMPRADELGVTRYLETIFACRIQDPDLELPELSPSSGDLTDFVESLQQALETSASRLAQAAQPPSHLPADLGETFAHVSFPIEGISRIEVLEELTTKQQKSLPLEGIALQAQADSALLTEEEQNAAFTKSPFAYAFTSLKLEELPKDAAVQKTKEKLEVEIASLQEKTAEVHAITKEGAEKVLDSVKKTATDLATKAEKARATIDETLKKADPKELTSLRELAGQVSRLSWAECLEAYLQNDFSALQAKTKNRVDIDSLKEQMKAFFLLETRRRHAELAIREISEFLQVPSLQKSASAQERLHEILSRPRYFDPNTYPQLLVMEYCLGFFLKEEQLQMGIDFVQHPNCIRQAVTGAGKTSAILPFVGLMKANGHNLVTLKFLDPLFSANLAAVQKLLGALKKKAVPLLFSADTPLVIQKSIGERVEQESVFKEMYETAQKVILQKGCLITNKKTQPLLKAKLIELYEKLTPLPTEDRSPMDIQHLLYLGKLLVLFKEREETLYDEFDKFLSPKEELHLRVEAGNPIPQFLSDTALEMFDLLLANKTLALRENGQDHLSAEQQKTILTETATALAREKSSELNEDLLTSYFQGTISEEEENILVAALEKLPPIDRDRIALQKDLLKILSTTLFKAADKDYARSKRDGESVIPCAYADTPKEGSEYDDVRVRLCYLIQYVYQKGVGFDSFAKWVKELKETVEKDLANGIKLEETVGEKLFKSYFPEESLDTLNQDKLKRLHETLGQDPALLRRFLSVMTQKLRMPGTRISLNPHNQVSIAHSSSGTSATLGCLEGMHRNFDTADLSSSTAQGKMIHRLLKRVGKGKTIQYNPTKPGEIVPSLLAQEKGAKVLIDGAGALRGVAGDVSARQLQEGQEGLKAVAYFDLAGDIQSVGSGSLEETGCIYSHAQARGADRTLPVDHRAVLIVNGKTPQEEVSQNEGRLRKEDQPLTLAVPTGSPIQDVGDLVNAGLTQQAKAQAELLFLSKQQELQDIVHSAMVDHLVDCSAQGAMDNGFALYTKYQKAGLLVSTHRENWEQSGSYFTQHNRIERAAPPLQVLQKSKNHYSSVAKECGLDGVPEKLTDAYKKIKKLRDLLPETVSSALETDKEAQVEVETEIEVSIETETELDVATEKPGQPTYYLPWNWKRVGLFHHDYYNKQFSAFDHRILLSPNFAPLGRNALAPPIHQRHWHDPKQSRLRYVEFERMKSSYSDDSWTNAIALDQLDFEETLKEPKKSVDIYDTVLHRYIIGGADLSEDDQNLRNRLIAQMRFADGQCSGYTEKEWDALTKWIQEQDNPEVLETYFLEQVLKYRPKERQRYQFSPLANLFRSKPTS